MVKVIDGLSGFLGRIAAWAFFAIGAILVFEVAMRYLFNAPTIWAAEVARLALLWATYLAAAYLLRMRGLIRVTFVVDRIGLRGRRLLEAFALVWIAAFSFVAIWYGLDIALESIRIGRVPSTMLAWPQWVSELAIPVGFALLLLQTVAELTRLIMPTATGYRR